MGKLKVMGGVEVPQNILDAATTVRNWTGTAARSHGVESIEVRIHSGGKIEVVPGDAVGQPSDTSDGGEGAGGGKDDEGVNASKAAMELMAEYSVDPATVQGSGRDGQVTKPDVEAHLVKIGEIAG